MNNNITECIEECREKCLALYPGAYRILELGLVLLLIWVVIFAFYIGWRKLKRRKKNEVNKVNGSKRR